MGIDVAGYLAEQQRKASASGQPDLAQQWINLEQLYNKKLWHQLTLAVGQFVKQPAMQQGDALINFYQQFLCDFEHRVNCLALMEIALIICAQFKNETEALEFLDKMKGIVKGSDEATVLCMTAIGNIKLKQEKYDDSKLIVKQAQELLDTLDEVTSVHGRFYQLSSKYHMIMGNHADYYRDALRFLGCMDISEMSQQDQADQAFHLGLAAILGKNVYNFGELLAHPVLSSLNNSSRQWLVDLLYAFNAGNIEKFNQLSVQWKKQLDLAAHEVQMMQKITLLCLMEMTFKRAATNRRLTFQDIANEARIPLDEVELLVMKALSLSLVRGSIDEVDLCVHMTWVQPRVLDKNQIGTMKDKMKTWSNMVMDMERLVEVRAHDILT